MRRMWLSKTGLFLSTPSARRATKGRVLCGQHRGHFYPRPPRGGRPFWRCRMPKRSEFLSTPSARRATGAGGMSKGFLVFLSTPSARRATCLNGSVTRWKIFLSTPSARRATRSRSSAAQGQQHFYPRPPRGGRRQHGQRREDGQKFLSTPSARRATLYLRKPLEGY